MAARRLKLRISADERTDPISDESLLCRSNGHRWVSRPWSEARLRETLKKGVIENERWCENGCGSTWSEVLDANTFETLSAKRSYASDYLLKPGNGRIRRPDARKSMFVRNFPQFV